MRDDVVFFTIAGDPVNLGYAQKMEKSFHHFHPDIRLEIFGEEEIKKANDPNIFYRATPLYGRILLEKYPLVIKIDADSVVTGKLDHIIDDKTYDVGCVLNWNRVDPPRYNFPLTVWDIPMQDYMNCGFVAMRSLPFVNQWWRLCLNPKFFNYRFREQDLLNIMYHYGDYSVKCFDHSNQWHGLVSKGEWLNFEKRGEEIFLPIVDKYPDAEKKIKVIHFAGGEIPDKMNFRKYFKGDVMQYLIDLTEGYVKKESA